MSYSCIFVTVKPCQDHSFIPVPGCMVLPPSLVPAVLSHQSWEGPDQKIINLAIKKWMVFCHLSSTNQSTAGLCECRHKGGGGKCKEFGERRWLWSLPLSLSYGETTRKVGALDPSLFISCPSRDFQADSAANLFLTTFLLLSALIALLPVVI